MCESNDIFQEQKEQKQKALIIEVCKFYYINISRLFTAFLYPSTLHDYNTE